MARTLGELKVACIKLMFDNDEQELMPDQISENADYHARTNNIIESINRALVRIASAGKLPLKTAYFDKTQGERGKYHTRYDLSFLDVFDIVRITYENDDKGIYDTNIAIMREGNKTLVLKTINEGRYIVSYKPKPPVFTYDDPDTKEIDLPNAIIEIIPYFVKGDLYETDDPDAAVLSRNLFEGYLSALPSEENDNITQVESYYSLW